MKKGFALYDAVEGYGYCVQVFEVNSPKNTVMLEEYRAGDALGESMAFGTGEVKLQELLEYARQTACNILENYSIKGRIERDEDILAEERGEINEKAKA